jgi:hypothetical protein
MLLLASSSLDENNGIEKWKKDLMKNNEELIELKSRIDEVTLQIAELREDDKEAATLKEIEKQQSLLQVEQSKIDLLKEINIARNHFIIYGKSTRKEEKHSERIDNLISSLLDAIQNKCSRLTSLVAMPAEDEQTQTDSQIEKVFKFKLCIRP